MSAIVLLVAALCGAAAGSFLGVVVQRLPRARSLVTPPSHCDHCGTRLAWFENVPIAGWLLLAGRCRHCGFPIPPACLWLELGLAVLSAGIVWLVLAEPKHSAAWLMLVLLQSQPVLLAWLPPLAAGAVLLLVAWILVAVVLIDYRHLIIPDELSKGLQALAIPLAVLTGTNAVWAEGVDGAFALPWDAVHWWRRHDVLQGWVPDCSGGALQLALAVVLGLAGIAATLPGAHWIYGKRVRERWEERDHRALALGVWWYIGCTAFWTVLGLGVVLLAPFPPPRGQWHADLLFAHAFSQAVLGSLVGWWLPWLAGLAGSVAASRNALGFGDVKLFAALGAFLGPLGAIVAFAAAVVGGAVVGIPARLLGAGRELPFGPALAYGTALTIAVGPWAWPWLWARWLGL